MSTEALKALFDRAKTIDILADDLTVLLDAAAQMGMAELVETTRVLNERGIKMGILREYGETRRKYHALKQREQRKALDEALRRAYPGAVKYDCLR